MHALTALLIITLCGAAHAAPATGPTTRRSADGVNYPEAVPERRFKDSVPFIGTTLGDLPEHAAGRVYNAKTSQTAFDKKTELGDHQREFRPEWFVVGLAGSDIAGIDLRDGRVIRVALLFHTLPDTKRVAMEKAFAAHKTKSIKTASVVLSTNDQRSPVTVTIEIDQVEWYLAYHPETSDKIAAALREGKAIKEMDDDQRDLIGDGPGVYEITVEPNTGPIRGGGVAVGGGVNDLPVGIGSDIDVVREQAESKAAAVEKINRKRWLVKKVKKLPLGTVPPDSSPEK